MKNSELQQADIYMEYITSLGWQYRTIDETHIIYKHFPFVGGLAKMQRAIRLPDSQKFIKFLKEAKIKTLAIEPAPNISQKEFDTYTKTLLESHIQLNRSPFLPTKTILVDLTPTEAQIFSRFSEAKRRAVRRAAKFEVTIETSSDITKLITVKNKSAGLFGFITTYGVRNLWTAFGVENTDIVLARNSRGSVVGGVFLVYWAGTAYYWIAGATKEGKKLFAPTLLVSECLKISKKKGMKAFDFIGVWDERMPKDNTAWTGFTKFKEGFGGTELYYPILQK